MYIIIITFIMLVKILLDNIWVRIYNVDINFQKRKHYRFTLNGNKKLIFFHRRP